MIQAPPSNPNFDFPLGTDDNSGAIVVAYVNLERHHDRTVSSNRMKPFCGRLHYQSCRAVEIRRTRSQAARSDRDSSPPSDLADFRYEENLFDASRAVPSPGDWKNSLSRSIDGLPVSLSSSTYGKLTGQLFTETPTIYSCLTFHQEFVSAIKALPILALESPRKIFINSRRK